MDQCDVTDVRNVVIECDADTSKSVEAFREQGFEFCAVVVRCPNTGVRHTIQLPPASPTK